RELVAGIREKRWSAAQVIRDYVTRIDAVDPSVQAWEHLHAERALAQAAAVDAGNRRGALHGVPVAIKDIIDVQDMPTRYGSTIYAGAGPGRQSARCVAALERAGAIVLGKSVTTEFAYYTPGKT